MPCIPLTVRDTEGKIVGSGFLCSRRGGRRCHVCKVRKATQECDYPKGGGTCDKPLCVQCAVKPARNVDYCPDHPNPQASLFERQP